MDITPQTRDRLNALVEERRLSLGITWRELARSAGVSYEAVRALRRGPGGIAELTARKLDRALQWQGGSIAAIISGDPAAPAELPQPERGAAVADLLPPVVRDNWHNPYVRRFWERTRGEDINQDLRLILAEDLAQVGARGGDGSGSGASAAGQP